MRSSKGNLEIRNGMVVRNPVILRILQRPPVRKCLTHRETSRESFPPVQTEADETSFRRAHEYNMSLTKYSREINFSTAPKNVMDLTASLLADLSQLSNRPEGQETIPENWSSSFPSQRLQRGFTSPSPQTSCRALLASTCTQQTLCDNFFRYQEHVLAAYQL
eukprot:190722-Hanusia_phi.AAC.5